jgi:putative transposase
MTNHFHLVVETPQANLSAFMRQFNVLYTGYFNRRHRRVGHLYQGRFKAIVVEAEAYLTTLSRYVHLNPIRIQAVRQQDAEAQLQLLKRYRWSSLTGYINKQQRSPLLTYALVLASFGGDTTQGRRAYARFMEDGVRGQLPSPWVQLRGQVVLGTEAFVARLRPQIHAAPEAAREQPARRALEQPWDLEAALAVLAHELGREVSELCQRGGGLEQALVMECLYRVTGASQRLIGQRLGGVDYSWISRQRKRVPEALARDPALHAQFVRLQAALSHK